MSAPNQAGSVPHAGPLPDEKPQVNLQHTPSERLRRRLERLWEQAQEVARCLLFYRIDSILLTGLERESQLPLKVLYVGTGENLAYLKQQIFQEPSERIQARDRHPLRFQSLVKPHSGTIDLLLLDLPWPISHLPAFRNMLTLPPWIRTVIPLGNRWDSIVSAWGSTVKGVELRRIRKHKMTYRLSDSEEAFRHFFHHHYKPFVEKRFGEAAHLDSEELVVSTHWFGELIEVLRDDTVIASSVLIQDGSSLGFHWIGAPVDLDAKFTEGAMGGLYYYITRLAYERGCDEIDCFTNRPKLDDGVLKYKRRWGARLTDFESLNGLIHLKPERDTPAIQSFLQHNPMITTTPTGFVGRCVVGDERLDEERLKSCYQTWWAEGLERLRIDCLKGYDDALPEIAQALDSRIELVDLSTSTDPWERLLRP